MQATHEHLSDHHVFTSESAANISEDLQASLNLDEKSCSRSAISDHRDVYVDAKEHEHEHEHEHEEEFSFIFEGSNTSPIAAEDAFMNGQIRSNTPLFETDLLLGEVEGLPTKPQVRKVFIQMKDNDDNQRSKMTSASSENDEISGPFCEWSKKASEDASSTEVCQKSNSTGFSKLWRFKEFRSNRSNSDGRDAFVYLNNNHPTTSSSSGGNVEVKLDEGKGKVKRAAKPKTASLSPHEIYLKNKAKEDDRRKSYLPYRQEVVGFFTNVNGGMSKNVHPF